MLYDDNWDKNETLYYKRERNDEARVRAKKDLGLKHTATSEVRT